MMERDRIVQASHEKNQPTLDALVHAGARVETPDFTESFAALDSLALYGERHRAEHSLSGLIKAENYSGLVPYFYPEIVDIVRGYSRDNPTIDPLDMAQDAALALTTAFATQRPHPVHVRDRAVSMIERAVQLHVLGERLERIACTPDTPQLARTGHDAVAARIVELDKEVVSDRLEAVLRFLTPKAAETLRLYYGLGDCTETPIGKIAKHFDESVTNASLRRRSSLSRIQSLREGADLGALYRDVYGLEYPRGAATVAPDDERAMLAEIVKLLGMPVADFMERHGMSQREFAKFIGQILPRLGGESSVRIVELGAEERAATTNRKYERVTRFRDLDSIRRAISELGEGGAPLNRGQELDIRDRLREIFFPRIIRDREATLAFLDAEAVRAGTPPKLGELLGATALYFRSTKILLIPGLSENTVLDEFQKIDIEIATRRPCYLIGSEMGTGKSLESIAVALRHGARRILIVSTKSGASITWPNELRKHLEGGWSGETLEGADFRSDDIHRIVAGGRWFVSTYHTVSDNIALIRSLGFDMVILDECHKINNLGTAQSLAIRTLDPPMKLAVSGSVFKNRRLEMFAVLNWLYPREFPTLEGFDRDFCRDDVGADRLRHELSSRMVCRFKDQVLALPPVTYHTQKVPLAGKAGDEYRRMERDFVAWMRGEVGGDVERLMSNQVLFAKLHGLREKAIEVKLDAIADTLTTIRARGEKAALYTTYLSACQEFGARFGQYGIALIEGRTGITDRRRMVDSFRDDSAVNLFLLTAAGGESIDLTTANNFIFGNQPLTSADSRQAVNRVDRRGQTRPMNCYNIIVEGTIEERIQELIESKRIEFLRVIRQAPGEVPLVEESENDNLRALLTGLIGSSA